MREVLILRPLRARAPWPPAVGAGVTAQYLHLQPFLVDQQAVQSTELGRQGTLSHLCSAAGLPGAVLSIQSQIAPPQDISWLPLGLPLSHKAPTLGKAVSGAGVPRVSLKPGVVWQGHH